MFEFEIEYLDGTTHVETVTRIAGEISPLTIFTAWNLCVARLRGYGTGDPDEQKRSLANVTSIGLIR